MTRTIGNFRNKRIEWLDSAKGIVIILMLYGHFDNIPCMVKAVIYSFHMPFFFILSGYFIDKKNIDNTLHYKEDKATFVPLSTGGTSSHNFSKPSKWQLGHSTCKCPLWYKRSRMYYFELLCTACWSTVVSMGIVLGINYSSSLSSFLFVPTYSDLHIYPISLWCR